jgi:hypothetical protein
MLERIWDHMQPDLYQPDYGRKSATPITQRNNLFGLFSTSSEPMQQVNGSIGALQVLYCCRSFSKEAPISQKKSLQTNIPSTKNT